MSLESRTILVIEDNELNRKLCRAILENFSATVVEAETAEAGLKLLERQQPDLILMDIQLPGMDGLQATKIIKKHPVWKDIPVVACTAHAMQGDELKIEGAGCDGYITKPYNIVALADEVDQIIRQREYSNK